MELKGNALDVHGSCEPFGDDTRQHQSVMLPHGTPPIWIFFVGRLSKSRQVLGEKTLRWEGTDALVCGSNPVDGEPTWHPCRRARIPLGPRTTTLSGDTLMTGGPFLVSWRIVGQPRRTRRGVNLVEGRKCREAVFENGFGRSLRS